MRAVLLIVTAAVLVAACKKSSAVTNPANTDAFSVAGAWTGCMPQSGSACTAVSMTLSDSSLTDSTATVKGSGSWGEPVTISGKLTDANFSLTGSAPGILQKWTFVGAVSGTVLSGTMTVPDGGAGVVTTFNRTP